MCVYNDLSFVAYNMAVVYESESVLYTGMGSKVANIMKSRKTSMNVKRKVHTNNNII